MKFSGNYVLFTHLIYLQLQCVIPLPAIIRIGVLYNYADANELLELFVKAAIEAINTNEDILPNSKLVYQEFYLKGWKSYESYDQVCDEFRSGSMAIIGPQDLMSLSHVKSVCESLEVPHIQAIWDHSDSKTSPISLNVFPQSDILSQAYLDAIRHWKWHDVVILYQHYTALINLQSIIKEPPSETMKVRVINMTPSSRIRIMKMLKQMGWSNIIIDGSPVFTQSILRAGLQLEMMNENYHYLLTNLDIETVDLEDYKYNGVYMNGFKIFYDPNMRLLEKKYSDQIMFDRFSQAYPLKENEAYTEAAMMYDAVWVLAHGLQSADKSMTISAPNISCKHEQPTGYGTSLFNYLNSVEITGLTGPIKFKNGARSYFNLDLLELDVKGLYKVGYWTPTEGLNVIPKQEDSKYISKFAANKSLIITSILRPLIITTILERPYVMYSKCHYANSCVADNDHFEGFCMDMLNKMGKKLGFKYRIVLVPDGKYGAPNKDGEWTGMIRELMDNRADLAVAPLTINWLREQVVDFTKPFMSLGISILFKLPEKSKPGLFSFLNPLSIEIWLYVVAAFFGISILLFTLARFSPYEWVNTHPPCCVTHYLCYNGMASEDPHKPAEKGSAGHHDSKKLSKNAGNAKKSKLKNSSGHKQINGNTNVPPSLLDESFYMANTSLKSFDQVDFFTNEVYQRPTKVSNGLPKRDALRLDLKNFNYHQPVSPKPAGCRNKDPSCQSSSLPFTPFPQSFQPPVSENRFTLTNSLWFTLGTLMQQGSDISPSATSTRIVGGVWWFFTLILISSYTANLAAFLTVEKMVSPIESAEDLAEQTTIAYGTLASGSTYTFYKNAKVTLFKKMWKFMESRGAQVFTKTQDEGVKRVLDGNYAFFMESTTIDYIIQRNCNLTQIGGLLDSKGYGIGTPLGSPFRDPISLAILEMQENGQITLLYNKWWKNIGVTCHRDAVSKESKASELGLENVGGIFVVLLGGIACSFIVGILEFIWKARKCADSYKQSLCSQMGEELKYAIKCKESRQRPRLKRQCSQCHPTSNYPPYNNNNTTNNNGNREGAHAKSEISHGIEEEKLNGELEGELRNNIDSCDGLPAYFNPTLSNFPNQTKGGPNNFANCASAYPTSSFMIFS